MHVCEIVCSIASSRARYAPVVRWRKRKKKATTIATTICVLVPEQMNMTIETKKSLRPISTSSQYQAWSVYFE